jgi:hypothetical protein
VSLPIETPIGLLSWGGKLNEETEISFSDGSSASFYSLISHTNGSILQWLKDYL